MKRIRRPLTDINGNDFVTGQPVISEFSLEAKVAEMKKKWKEKVKKEAVNGMVHVEGFGMVKCD